METNSPKIELPESPEVETGALPETDDNGMNWGELSGEQGGDDEGYVEGDLEVAAVAPPEEKPQAAPVAPVAEIPVPASAAPQPAPVVPEPAPAAPVQQTPSQIPAVPVQPTVDMGAWEQEQIQNLSKFYSINEEDAQKLQTEPELVLPQLAANMHMSITKSILASVHAMMPQVLTQHNQQVTAEQQARSDFYSANPDLNKPEYEQAVMQIASMFRAANKTADRNTAIKTIGDMARMSLGLPLQQSQQVQPNPAGTMPTPAPSIPAPFTPSKTGGSAGNVIKQPNPWEDLLD